MLQNSDQTSDQTAESEVTTLKKSSKTSEPTCQSIESFALLQSRWRYYTQILLWVTFIWNIIEGTVSIYFGQNSSNLSVIAFGIDSLIEVLSSGLLIYNFNTSQFDDKNTKNKSMTLFNLETERKLTLTIGYLLLLFAICTIFGSIYRLLYEQTPSSSVSGIIISAVALITMTILWVYKTKGSVILNSSSLQADANCSFGCIKLSTVLLIGCLIYNFFNLWYIDSITAIIIALLIAYEGYETVKNAHNKEKFTGGCGCCAGSDSWLAKKFRKTLDISSKMTLLIESKKINYNTLNESSESNELNNNEKKKSCKKKCCGSKNKKGNNKKIEISVVKVTKSEGGCCKSKNGGCKSKSKKNEESKEKSCSKKKDNCCNGSVKKEKKTCKKKCCD